MKTEIGYFGQIIGERYELCVSDNGAGMSPDEASQAFDPFYRALRSQEAPGTGLGLSIVKRVIEASRERCPWSRSSAAAFKFLLRLPLA